MIIHNRLKTVLIYLAVVFSSVVHASDIAKIHFIIPGGEGGGWDGTARGTGEVLTESNLVGTATYENMSGNGGGKALGYLYDNASSQYGSLLVNSTPIVMRSLTKQFPYSFRDFTPIASIIGDYAALVVRKDSHIKDFEDLMRIYSYYPDDLVVAGGSSVGSMDHLVPVMAFEAAGVEDPKSVNYRSYDGGGEAMIALLSEEADVLSTGLSEALEFANSGDVRILIHTGPERVDVAQNVPTLKEQDVDIQFVNWRGFFGAPNMPTSQQQSYVDVLEKMYKTPEWEKMRKRNGWVNVFNPDEQFTAFLDEQEKSIKELMQKLDFL